MQLCMLSCKEGFIAAGPPVVFKKPAFLAKDTASEGENLPASMCFEEKLANFVLRLAGGAVTATSVETSSWTPKSFSECAECAFVAPFMRQPINSFNSPNPSKRCPKARCRGSHRRYEISRPTEAAVQDAMSNLRLSHSPTLTQWCRKVRHDSSTMLDSTQ